MLFADHGLSVAQISSLFAIWSVTGFLLEVPSGALADTVSRRGLLMVSSALLAAGFMTWTVLPGYLGFAVGFVLWGAAGALQSGTFQALLYDELRARDTAHDYPRVLGYSIAAGEAAALTGILLAAPLFALGGYLLVGLSSAGVALIQLALAASLPRAPVAASVADVEALEDADGAEPDVAGAEPDAAGSEPDVAGSEPDVAGAGPREAASAPTGGYLAMLRAGVGEALRVRTVRFGVLLVALLYGFTAIDEYFALIAEDRGVATATIPWLVGITVAGSLVGTALAGRTAGVRSRTMAGALLVGGALLIVGPLLGGPGLLGLLGFVAIGVGYGIVNNAHVVTESRLQDAIAGPARATVTSVAGLAAEVVALAIFGAAALASVWWSTPVTVALLAIPVLVVALAVPRWMPGVSPISDAPRRTQPDRR